MDFNIFLCIWKDLINVCEWISTNTDQYQHLLCWKVFLIKINSIVCFNCFILTCETLIKTCLDALHMFSRILKTVHIFKVLLGIILIKWFNYLTNKSMTKKKKNKKKLSLFSLSLKVNVYEPQLYVHSYLICVHFQ